ncbi:MAG: hypothetical protein MPJ50_15870 [Pirellulales bacterium]|nr:hypothetical protein [Pirellulales bacterium]
MSSPFQPPEDKQPTPGGRFTLQELLTGVLMSAVMMGGLRLSILLDGESTAILPFTLFSAGLGGLIGVFIRWNPWLTSLLGIAVLWALVVIYVGIE